MALTERQIAQMWVDEGGDPKYALVMAKIAKRESSGNPRAQNLKHPDHSIGLFQINQLAHKGRFGSDEELMNPTTNVRAAVRLFKETRKAGMDPLRPWSTYNPEIDRKYIGKDAPYLEDGAGKDRFKSLSGKDPLQITTPSVKLGSTSSASDRVQAAMKMLEGKSSPLDFAMDVKEIQAAEARDATVLEGNTFTLTPAQKEEKNGVRKGGGKSPVAGGGWGGSEGIIEGLNPIAREYGAPPTNFKRSPEENAAVGGSEDSDHLTTNSEAYAADYSISGDKGTELAKRIAQKLGVGFRMNDYNSGGVIVSKGHRYKVQILYGSGINHGDHVHVGVRRIG